MQYSHIYTYTHTYTIQASVKEKTNKFCTKNTKNYTREKYLEQIIKYNVKKIFSAFVTKGQNT